MHRHQSLSVDLVFSLRSRESLFCDFNCLVSNLVHYQIVVLKTYYEVLSSFFQVAGLDELGHEFRRMSLTAINALEPAAPEVYMPPVTKGYYDKPALLMCAVDSIVPFSVQWMRGEQKLGAPLFYT